MQCLHLFCVLVLTNIISDFSLSLYSNSATSVTFRLVIAWPVVTNLDYKFQVCAQFLHLANLSRNNIILVLVVQNLRF